MTGPRRVSFDTERNLAMVGSSLFSGSTLTVLQSHGRSTEVPLRDIKEIHITRIFFAGNSETVRVTVKPEDYGYPLLSWGHDLSASVVIKKDGSEVRTNSAEDYDT